MGYKDENLRSHADAVGAPKNRGFCFWTNRTKFIEQ